MSVELDVDAACGPSQTLGLFEEEQELQTDYYKLIFAPPFYPVQFMSNATKDFETEESLKTEAVVSNKLEKKIMKHSTEVEGSVNFSIGPDGVNFEGADFKASASDDKGNHVDVDVNYDHESRTADVSVGGGNKS